MNDYTNLLREHNLKATPQRLAIMDVIEAHGHINIDKLYEEVKKRFSSISLATIYKNINSMVENFLLFEVKLPHKKSVYEIVKGEHSHLLCKSCHEVMDIELDTDNIITAASSKYDFKVDGSDVVLFGICSSCQKA
jgi:Fur family peroxide stress response transcriptional regulator